MKRIKKKYEVTFYMKKEKSGILRIKLIAFSESKIRQYVSEFIKDNMCDQIVIKKK